MKECISADWSRDKMTKVLYFRSHDFTGYCRIWLFHTFATVTLTFRPMTLRNYTVLATDQGTNWHKFGTSGCIFTFVIEFHRRHLSFHVSVTVTLTFDLLTLKKYTVLEIIKETIFTKFHAITLILSWVIASERNSYFRFCDLDLWPFDLDQVSLPPSRYDLLLLKVWSL